MKKILSIILCVCIMSGMTLNVFAEDTETVSTGVFQSGLTENVSYDITFGEIQTDISNYIAFNNLEVEFGTEAYYNLMNEFAFDAPNTLSETTKIYYGAYASIYLGDKDMESVLNKTISEIRDENAKKDAEISETTGEGEGIATYETYNVGAAQNYATAYAMVDNYSYPSYGADCTNFASQILHAGGFNTTSLWNIWAGPGTEANYNWINVQGFLYYWGLTRGYYPTVCFNLSSVNANASAGDFLVWKNRTTYEYFHTQFVQSKVNGAIYCTQHSSYYYNQKLNDRLGANGISGNEIYILKF